ncbi:uncharacterized protein [Miscanthus floridulus]|uniref:uncharacterized protein n=1 Tax=Miscanthus floridulus TaxID=154761 RepID=UPI003457A518
MAKRDKKAKEEMKKAKRLKQEAWDQGEDVSSEDDDNDDDDNDDDKGSESMRSVEAGESAASHGVPAEDWWMGDAGLAAADPKATMEGGGTGAVPGSDAAPCEVMEGSSFGATPCETMEGSSSGAAPRETMEGDSSGAAPNETMEGSDSGAAPDEMNPPALEQGAGMKWSRPDESGQGSGDPSPKRFYQPRTST